MAFDPKQAGAALNQNMASSMQGFAAASKAMQAVTNEMMSMSMESMRDTASAFEQMQGARNWTDIARIQTEFFHLSFEKFASRSRRIAELATAAPMDLAKRATDTVAQIGDQTQQAAKSVANDAKAASVGLETGVPGHPAS